MHLRRGRGIELRLLLLDKQQLKTKRDISSINLSGLRTNYKSTSNLRSKLIGLEVYPAIRLSAFKNDNKKQTKFEAIAYTFPFRPTVYLNHNQSSVPSGDPML